MSVSLTIQPLKEKTVSDIPRYRMTNSFGYQDNENGLWVRYEDHVKWVDELEDSHEAEIELMRLLLVPRPEPKFKLGDRVLLDDKSEFLVVASRFSCGSLDWLYDLSTVSGKPVTRVSASRIKLYVPPTPAELIPTLKEHEWVQGTLLTEGSLYKNTFGPGTTYIWESGLWVSNVFLCDVRGFTSGAIETIERCNPPEVK